MLGIGEANVREVRTNDRLRMDLARPRSPGRRGPRRRPPALLRRRQRRHGRDGRGGPDRARSPTSPAATISGSTWTPPTAVSPRSRPRRAPLFDGIGEADSVALDPHKWLYLPVGCGCVLYRDPAAARAAFSHGAEYTRTIGLEHDEAFAFWDYGPELSRPFRALDLWLLVK